MTAVPARHALWDRLGRSLLPTYGARANAADSLVDLRRTRLARLERQDAPARPAPARPPADTVVPRGAR